MNEEIRERSAVDNPFVFKHISNLKGMDHFDDVGPCVVLASPGMMQSGLSRELFESWCTDARNCCIVAGYCVEGTMAKYILSEPEDVPTMSPGSRLPLKMKVSSISFSAHADFKQTSNFIRYSPKEARFASALRADGLRHMWPLLVLPWTSPTP